MLLTFDEGCGYSAMRAVWIGVHLQVPIAKIICLDIKNTYAMIGQKKKGKVSPRHWGHLQG